jgi:hypothetical protein
MYHHSRHGGTIVAGGSSAKAQGAVRRPLLFLFDFDDTLFPTSQIKRSYPKAMRGRLSLVPSGLLQPVFESMRELLLFCCEQGEVCIVSAGAQLWLDRVLVPHLQHPALRWVQVMSSRSCAGDRLFPSKLAFFLHYINAYRCRAAFIIGDGADEAKASRMLPQYVDFPIVYFPIPKPSPCLTVRAMVEVHQKLQVSIERLAAELDGREPLPGSFSARGPAHRSPFGQSR